MRPVSLHTAVRLSDSQVAAVQDLVREAAEADGHAPLSEHVMLHLPLGGDEDVRHVLALGPGGLRGYAHLDVTDPVAGPSGELVVRPSERRQGLGRALVQELVRLGPGGRLRLWAHGEHPDADRLALALGFTRSRVLWQMRRELTGPLPAYRLPDGVRLRPFEVGRDEQEWTGLNARAFAGHPEQGRWGIQEVLLREKEPWFDPAGFLLAEQDGALVGFHWTKVHGSDPGHPHQPVGEVYVVGVDPGHQGRGLGPALTLAGLHLLQAKGLGSVLLYVDEDNTTAVGLYRRLGFARVSTDVCWST